MMALSTIAVGVTRRWLATIAVACAAGLALLPATPALGVPFNRADLLSDDTFRSSPSMSQAEVLEFLQSVPGMLKSYSAPDHTGVRKPAYRIIWEAAQAWNISPKVILSMLQKEQGLLTIPDPEPERVREAMGCGVFPGSTNTYPGFGNQVWNGTRKLATYEVTYAWRPGKAIRVGGVNIVPANAATFALYTYTPMFHGNEVFSDVYRRYFGDPHAAPRFSPVYRFYGRGNAAYLFTASQSDRIRITTTASRTWQFQGVGLVVDTSSTANVSPLYRMYNRRTGKYFYTASIGEMNSVIKKSGRAYRLDRIVCYGTKVAESGVPVFRLYSKVTGACLITASPIERDRLVRRSGFRLDCVVFYLGS
jgi:hypothetical protein